MLIDSKEVLNYCDVQKRTFEMLAIGGDFNKGLIEGINLVKTWVEISVKRAEPINTDGSNF